MTTLLQLKTSIFSADGHSSRLSDQFVAAWRQNHPDAQVIVRDLAVNPPPHLDAQIAAAFFAQHDQRTPEQQVIIDESDRLIAEIRQAQIIVIGLPMYNFGVPSTFKAYLDQITRAGITFRFTESGQQGLLTGKKAYIFATRGGFYAGTALDSESQFIRDFLGFLGITDIEFVYAEGLNIDESAKQAALVQAEQQLTALAAA
ncbi:MAG: NAD(P)H-dependent oxidoreductase [Methylomonas sp.]|jgi:FMN-dependent NADH-azoreductase